MSTAEVIDPNDELIDRASEVLREIAELERERKVLTAQFIENGAEPGDLLVSMSGKKIRVCDRGVLKDDLLRERVTASIWNQITKRKPVAALIQAMIHRGRLDGALVDACYERSRPWIEVR